MVAAILTVPGSDEGRLSRHIYTFGSFHGYIEFRIVSSWAFTSAMFKSARAITLGIAIFVIMLYITIVSILVII